MTIDDTPTINHRGSGAEPCYAVEQEEEHSDRALGPDPTIHPTACISRSHLGEWTEISQEVRMHESELGRYSYLMERCQLDYATIGKFSSIASNVRLGPTAHPTERPTQHHMTYRRQKYGFANEDENDMFERRRDQPVRVGHDVWLGHGATVLPDVTVATGAVVGAGAIVTKDVNPYEIVVGVPAESVNRRFDEKTAEHLMDTQWWDWSRETIEERFEEFRDLKLFIEKYS